MNTAVYVAGFALNSVPNEVELRAAFGQYGEITEVFVRSKANPFAFVTFTEASAAESAVAGGSVMIGGVECKVEIKVCGD